MVNGFTKFKERFQGFENQYVIIGGTACDLIMENEELPLIQYAYAVCRSCRNQCLCGIGGSSADAE